MDTGELRSVCVFCGSRPGTDPGDVAAAREVGRLLAGQGLTLVYGAGRYGLMGAVAQAALAAGGRVLGVIPDALVEREAPPPGLSALRVVGSMHERKALMVELSDAFIALPGGLGTLDELFEVLTWSQLGMHSKPVGLLDAAGYFRPLLAFLEHALARGYIEAEDMARIVVADSPPALLEKMRAWRPVPARRWIGADET